MIYRAVENRIAVDPHALKLNIPTNIILDKLLQMGFVPLQINVVAIANNQIGVGKYRRGASPTQAPEVVDCTSFTKWIYGQCGIWLPRYSIQQRKCGRRISISNISAGDIVFTTGFRNYYDVDPGDAVGHAGLVTGQGRVVHAANSRVGVVESSLADFLGSPKDFRGVVRLIPKNREIWCLKVPLEIWVETSDDIRWLILQRL